MTQWLNEQTEKQQSQQAERQAWKIADDLGRNLENMIEEFGFHAPSTILEPAEKALFAWKTAKETKKHK